VLCGVVFLLILPLGGCVSYSKSYDRNHDPRAERQPGEPRRFYNLEIYDDE